jgi:hypothetical protein
MLNFWFKHGLNIKLKTPKNGLKEKRVTFVTLSVSVVPTGIEPVTQGFSVLCSTN